MWTSAGVTTSIELALALVEDDLGHAVAMEIARRLALPMLRGAEQPQLSQALRAQDAATHRVRELVAWISTHLQEDLCVEALARRVDMSPRNFARAFAAEAGCTPARFVEQARVTAAAQLLRRTGWTQEKKKKKKKKKKNRDAQWLSFRRHLAASVRPSLRTHAARLSRRQSRRSFRLTSSLELGFDGPRDGEQTSIVIVPADQHPKPTGASRLDDARVARSRIGSRNTTK